MKFRVKVSFEGFSERLDHKIKDALKGIGLKWYAQGYNLANGERDICFDYEEGEKDEEKLG